MVKKKKEEKAPRQYTKRQISSIKRQKRRQNFIFYGGIGVIAVVIIIVLVGLYIGEIHPYRQTAIKVYDREFSVQYFMDAARFNLNQEEAEYRSQIFQTVVQSLPNSIQRVELIRLGAEEVGIMVEDDEAKTILDEEELDVNDASIDFVRSNLVRDRLFAEYFISEIPENADQVNIKAMLLESVDQVNEVRDRLEAGDNFTDLAKELSFQGYTKDVASNLEWRIEEWLEARLESSVPFNYAFQSQPGTLSGPVYDEDIGKNLGYWIVNVLERPGDGQAHLQVILVGSEQEAEVVMQRYVDGEDFGELAREFSQDEDSRDSGGDLGIVAEGSRTDVFNTNVFGPDSVDIGIIIPFADDDVTTTGGYWLIDVVDVEADRPIRDEDRSFLETTIWGDWLEQLFEEAAGEIDATYLSLDTLQWIMDELRNELG